MTYPAMTDYQDVVQSPQNAFSDPELKSAHVALSPLGLPAPLSGGFAITYKLRVKQQDYAVRCFHREVPGVTDRYEKIAAALNALASDYFVRFDYQPRGILVNGAAYPIVKMDWIEGDTLDAFLEKYASNGAKIDAVRTRFSDLQSFLDARGIAHGDLQNGNIIVHGDRVRLIDYDGMYVPGMSVGSGTEVGHKHFQHPGRRATDFGPAMDRFSFIVLDVSLDAVRHEPGLYRQFREGGETIIFKANDLADPGGSEVFAKLRQVPALRPAADRLAAICAAPISAVPTLTDFLAGRNIPVPPPPRVETTARPKQPQGYIGAFQVLDAGDFQGVQGRVGDKVELVGQITSVFEGVGRRGRGRGRPYVFINFGTWNQESVKIRIWSEGLSALSTRPSKAWVGKWISVTGLIEPPYVGGHYGRRYTNVGITVTSDSQIVQLSQTEARFRLGGRSARRDATHGQRPPTDRSNAEILAGLKGGADLGAAQQTSRSGASRPPSPMSRNQQVLATVRGVPSSSTPTPQGPGTPLLAKIPGWLWLLLLLAAIWLLSRL